MQLFIWSRADGFHRYRYCPVFQKTTEFASIDSLPSTVFGIVYVSPAAFPTVYDVVLCSAAPLFPLNIAGDHRWQIYVLIFKPQCAV